MRSGKTLGGVRTAFSLLVAWWVSQYAHAATITIDSFDFPDPGSTFFVPGLPPWGNGNPFVHQDPAGALDPDVPGVLGGQRDIFVKVEGDPLPISAAGIIGYETVYGRGLLQLATFGEPGTFVIAQYDGRDVELGNELVDVEDLGLVDLTDFGTNNRFRLQFNSVDAGDGSRLALSITVVGDGGSTTVDRDVPESVAPFQYDVPFADFPDPAPLSHAKSITLKFNGLATPAPNVDFELDYIVAVPEPATMAMLLGLVGSMLIAGLWCRRKR